MEKNKKLICIIGVVIFCLVLCAVLLIYPNVGSQNKGKVMEVNEEQPQPTAAAVITEVPAVETVKDNKRSKETEVEDKEFVVPAVEMNKESEQVTSQESNDQNPDKVNNEENVKAQSSSEQDSKESSQAEPTTKPKTKEEAVSPTEKPKVNEEKDSSNPSKPPEYTEEQTNPSKESSTPQSGDKRSDGAIFVPGFGWVEDSGIPNKQEEIELNLSGNIVGDM